MIPHDSATPTVEGVALYRDPSQPVEARVDDLLARMTLAEKIGQMTQIEKNSLTPADVAEHFLGSVLSGGGGNPTPNSATAWAQMVRAFQEAALKTRLAIPLLYGVDAVHGHSNVRGATIFPHNIGLGATRDADLVERIARVTAREMLATNVHWAFAPAVSVPRDIRWGRTYEGFSEDTAVVSELGAAHVRGLQNGARLTTDGERPVLASVKHFVGDGGTAWGSTPRYSWIENMWQSEDPQRWRLDQGVADLDEATLRAVHLAPYEAAIRAGARNIMVSYNSAGGQKMHANHHLLTEVLKGELGFEGFLISDWMATIQLDPDNERAIALAINAGLDMIMVPYDFKGFIEVMTRNVERGDIPLARIDDAVRRILRVKVELGLFEQPFGDEALLEEVGSEAHRAVARESVRKSLVLLKNERAVLPLAREDASLLVAGRAVGDIGLQCGGWTIEWQGGEGAITPGTTLLAAIRECVAPGAVVEYERDGEFSTEARADVGLVVLSEDPYSEGEGDRADLALSTENLALVERVRARCERLVVLLYSGRPLLINEVLAHSDAFVAGWLPGTEGQGIADVLFGDYPFSGALPHRWPRSVEQIPLGHNGREADEPLFPFGHGLRITPA